MSDEADLEDAPSGASLRGSHRLATVQRCQREWAFRYFWWYRPTSDNPWRLGGSLIHTAYQYLQAQRMLEFGLVPPSWFKTDLHTRLMQQALWAQEPLRSIAINNALSNLAHYMAFYSDDNTRIRPVVMEEEFFATVGELDPGGPDSWLDAEIVSCRVDLLYEVLDSGLEFEMDYKSHGRSRVHRKTGLLWKWREGEDFGLDWQSLMNQQILRLRRGAKVRGRVIQRTTRQEPWHHDRHMLAPTLDAYQRTPGKIRSLVRMERTVMALIEAKPSITTPEPNYDACETRFGRCDYWHVCRAGSSKEMLDRLTGSNYVRDPDGAVANYRRLRVLP